MINFPCGEDECTGCGACSAICVRKAIDIVKNDNGFYVPNLNENLCVRCGLCVKICPIKNGNIEEKNITDVYMAKNKKEDERVNSASGGLFPVIAKYIIKEHGVVYAAVTVNGVNVRHFRIDNIKDVSRAIGSKYVQSNTESTFQNVKRDLFMKKKVLYVGTPCQIYGLKNFLGKENDNLYTIDLVCHGVISPNIVKAYIKKLGYDIEKIQILWTDKEDGWHTRKFVIKDMKTGARIFSTLYNSSMLGELYANNVCLNNSCYNCKFKSNHSKADITLGDYWGIENIAPQFDDDKGVSLVINHTNKGNKIFEEVKNEIIYERTSMDDATKKQFALTSAATCKVDRNLAFRMLNEKGICSLYKKSCKNNLAVSLLKKIKNILYEKL